MHNYPKVIVEQIDQSVGHQLLEQVGGLYSRMTSTSLALYNHTICKHPDSKQLFLEMASERMLQISLLYDIIYQEKVDPRLWTIENDNHHYWSSSYHNYPNKIEIMYEYMISTESSLIDSTCKVINTLEDTSVRDLLHCMLDKDKSFLNRLQNIYNDIYK